MVGDAGTELARDDADDSRFGGLYGWVLIRGSRRVVVAAGTLLTFAVAYLATGVYLPSIRTGGEPVLRLAASLAGGLLPFVTLVLAVNQLVLSMELGSLFRLDRRMDAMQEFRDEVGEATDSPVPPAEPARLVDAILDAVVVQAETLTESTDETAVEHGRSVAAATRAVRADLREGAALFPTLLAVREYDPGTHLHRMREVRATLVDPEEAVAAAADGIEELERLLDVGQTFFWTVYVEEAMARLSRLVLFTGFLGVLAGVGLTLGYARLVAAELGAGALRLVVSVGVTLELLPFVVLFAYMLRIASVARTTAGFGPFVADGPGWD